MKVYIYIYRNEVSATERKTATLANIAMYHRWLNYALDEDESLTRHCTLLVDSPDIYQHSKTAGAAGATIGVTAIAIERQTGQFFISAGTDGSLSMWQFESRHSDDHTRGTNLNKRRHYLKGSIAEHRQPLPRKMLERHNVRQVKNIVTYSQRSLIAPPSISSTHYYDSFSSDEHLQSAPGVHTVTNCLFYARDNGMFITAGTDYTIKIWDTAAFQSVHSISLPYRINQIDTKEDLILCGLDDKNPCVLDLRNVRGKGMILGSRSNLPNSQVLCAKFVAAPTSSTSPEYSDTRYVITGDSAGSLRTWDLRMANRCVCTVTGAHHTYTNDISIEPTPTATRKFLSTGKDGKCKIWSTANGLCCLKRELTPADAFRNRTPKRTSRRLLWHEKYCYVNSDQGDLLIYECDTGALVHALSVPHTLNVPGGNLQGRRSIIQAMDIQPIQSNTVGPRLILGTDSLTGSLLDYQLTFM
ncbi:HEL300Cp [Eremothecium sinecaudum]|uniref:HEL300Cp n=1 Tax=Eremothecium sinecaudum TaxID=45286 RepID=A0A0X8HSE1_9SACH|nr:HEL300Cp [Eremothecium sinecaudum]AMD20981.1 HEL300Cp [Eremothecium sinecaudum]